MKILIIEDDKEVSDYIRKGLLETNFTVDNANNGKDGLFLATTESYDVIVVDRMLPELDGLTIIKTLRGAGNNTPALILSALGDVDHKVQGLRAGGDDYVVKPFAFSELHARLEALVRRNSQKNEKPVAIEVKDLTLDLLARKVKRGGRDIELQSREFKLLEYILNHRGQVVTRTMLLENVWDYNFDPQTNIIDVHVSRLRNKIDKGFEDTLIKTVRGSGYIVE